MSLDNVIRLGKKISDLEDKLKDQKHELEELRKYKNLNDHKVKFYDECIVNYSCIKMKDCYKELGFKSTKALGDYLISLGMCYRDDKHRLMFKPGFEHYFGYRKFYARGFKGMHLVLKPEGLQMLRMSCPDKEV